MKENFCSYSQKLSCQVSDLIRAPIKKIVNNSLNTYFRAFRFDGSQRVRIRCSANICWEKCHPVSFANRIYLDEHNYRSNAGVLLKLVSLTLVMDGKREELTSLS